MSYQQTIRRPVACSGIGLHSGKTASLVLYPAEPNAGIRFVRKDLPSNPEIPGLLDHVADTTLATSLALNGNRVSTVEHLMAALAGLEVDNVLVEVDGPELPIMDGSSISFVRLLRNAGVETQDQPRKFLLIEKPFCYEDGDKRVEIRPAKRLEVTYTIDFDHPLLGRQTLSFILSPRAFEKRISRARTFGFLKDVQHLWKNGFSLGGSLENAVVIDDRGVVNPEGLRYPNEFVRHKILDFIGDISLVGIPVLGAFTVHKSGHALNHAVMRALMRQPAHWRIVTEGETTPRWKEAESTPVFTYPHPALA